MENQVPPLPPVSSNVNTLETGENINEEKKEKKFRLQGSNVFLTYAACEIGCNGILEILQEKVRISKWIMCDEKHVDGTGHSHLLLHFASKLDTIDERFFDVVDENYNNYHPNIKVPGKDFKRWIQDKEDYCMKDGNFYASYEIRVIGRENYIKKKADLQAWWDDCRFRQLKSPFPLKIFGLTINEPTGDDKKCGLIVIGKPNSGKTQTLLQQVHDKQCYYVCSKIHKWDNYNGERLVVYDDMESDYEEVFKLMEIKPVNMYLPARYNNKRLPTGRIAVIILCNEDNIPRWINKEGVNERFNIIHWPPAAPSGRGVCDASKQYCL